MVGRDSPHSPHLGEGWFTVCQWVSDAVNVYSVASMRVLPRVLGLTEERSRNSATPSS
jgi:hypothetical protein